MGNRNQSPQLTVACVLWVGERKFRKRKYGPEWVQKLRNMVQRNLNRPHRFVCLTNTEVPGVETIIPLEDDLPGWWAKLELFKHDLGERVLFLDLDVLITGSLDEIVDYPSDFALIPNSSIINGHKPKGLKAFCTGEVDRFQSSVMVWSQDAPREVYDLFKPQMMEFFRGDQDWIGAIKPDADWLPKRWFAKLKKLKNYEPEDHHKVILAMPWKNPEAAKKFTWVSETWK